MTIMIHYWVFKNKLLLLVRKQKLSKLQKNNNQIPEAERHPIPATYLLEHQTLRPAVQGNEELSSN